MRTPRLLGTLALLLSLGASPLAAQHAQTRQGFWFGAGMGFGSLGCDGCGGDRTGGASGFFAKGGVGYARLHADTGIGSGSTSGLGILAGVGYDLRVGSNTSITPVANWFRGSFNGGSSDVLQLGLGVTLH